MEQGEKLENLAPIASGVPPPKGQQGDTLGTGERSCLVEGNPPINDMREGRISSIAHTVVSWSRLFFPLPQPQFRQQVHDSIYENHESLYIRANNNVTSCRNRSFTSSSSSGRTTRKTSPQVPKKDTKGQRSLETSVFENAEQSHYVF